MQNEKVYQSSPITEVATPNFLIQDAPKDYNQFDQSISDGNAPMTMPSPYRIDGKENNKRRKSGASIPNPHRKFSKEWFNHAYETAVEVGKWPRVAYILVGIILICVWIGIMVSFAAEETKYERNNMMGTTDRGGSSRGFGQVFMKGTLRQFNPDERSLSVSWSIAYVDSDNATLVDFGTAKNNTVHWNVYRDVKAVPEDRNSTTYDMAGQFRVDNITENPIAVLGAHPWDSVTTSIDFVQAIPGDPWRQPLFGYPFDVWSGQIVFALTDRDYSREAGLNNSFIVGAGDALLSDSTFNWRITASANDTCQVPDLDAGCELHVDFSGKRPGLVIFAAIVALIVNWLITLGIFLITGEAVIMRRIHVLRETDILGVCLTALFALPSVRSILPGAPDFGCILDLIGIIPNIIIISLCTTAIAVSKLKTRRSSIGKDD